MSWTFTVKPKVEDILFQIHDNCIHFGSTYKHYSNFTSQLTLTKHYRNLDLEISFS